MEVDWTGFDEVAEASESGIPALATVDPRLIEYVPWPKFSLLRRVKGWVFGKIADEG